MVTGGVPQNNQTEARLMQEWLVKQGVDAKRIVQDNYATSTVDNALYSRYALTQHRIKHAVLLSSGSHVRRGQALLEIATWETGPQGLPSSQSPRWISRWPSCKKCPMVICWVFTAMRCA
ncbi:YdcF family protein [Plesiomonas shigelloides]|nr:YdcF family protein [Plesiomonas shigelloides]